jgi:hypothetical protein
MPAIVDSLSRVNVVSELGAIAEDGYLIDSPARR